MDVEFDEIIARFNKEYFSSGWCLQRKFAKFGESRLNEGDSRNIPENTFYLSLPRVKRDDVSSKMCVELIFVEGIDFASSYLRDN